MNLGDPAWIAAIAALVAAIGTVGAFMTALIQIGVERKRRYVNEERDRRDRHLAQARLIAAVRGPEEWPEDRNQGFLGKTWIYLINSSQEPVYRLVVGVVFIQGAGGPRTLEEMLERHHAPMTTVSILPPGTHKVWIRGVGLTRALSGRAGAEVAFNDREGSHWIRRATGELEELPEEPLEYFQKRGLYGPYDLQVPEQA